MLQNSLLNKVLSLEKWVAGNDYSGYDPYDGLRSHFLRLVPLPGKYPKIAWIQFFKRCPVNLRPLFLIPKGRNPKGMGLFLSSYVHLYQATGKTSWLDKALSVAGWLETNISSGHSGKCWGYNFDWQSRAFFVPQGTPTIVNTSFIGHGFVDLFQVTGDNRWLDVASSACEFILTDLNRYENGDHICFSYTPIDTIRVHNANLLGCGLLARVSKTQDRTEWGDVIRRSAQYSLDHQRSDGSWYYAETDYQDWIDSFHTGFNLMSLKWIGDYLSDETTSLAIEKGETFYSESFFLPDGTPKYYHDRTYPIDIHSPAMALRYFSDSDNYSDLCDRVADWMIENMLLSNGTFAFQINEIPFSKGRLTYSNNIPYMRWGQAWAMYGLTSYLLMLSKQQGHIERNSQNIASDKVAPPAH